MGIHVFLSGCSFKNPNRHCFWIYFDNVKEKIGWSAPSATQTCIFRCFTLVQVFFVFGSIFFSLPEFAQFPFGLGFYYMLVFLQQPLFLLFFCTSVSSKLVVLRMLDFPPDTEKKYRCPWGSKNLSERSQWKNRKPVCKDQLAAIFLHSPKVLGAMDTFGFNILLLFLCFFNIVSAIPAKISRSKTTLHLACCCCATTPSSFI